MKQSGHTASSHSILQSAIILAKAQMKARYRKTFAGFLWVILNPLLTYGVHAIIFIHILKIEMQNYFLFLLSGLIPWIFITSTLNMTTNLFVVSRDLLLSFRINPLTLLLSQIMDNLINFVAAFVILFCGLTLFTDVHFNLFGMLLGPVAVLLMLVSVFVVSFLMATIQVFYRDMAYINTFLTGLMYLLTPIFYPKSLIPEQFRLLTHFNPYFAVIEPFQICFWSFSWEAWSLAFARAVMWLAVWSTATLFIWRRSQNEFYLRI